MQCLAWKYTIDIADPWRQAKDRQITPSQLSLAIAARLRKCRACDADEMAEQFEIFAHAVDGEADMAAFDDFDGNMADLYDWADRERVLISK